MSSAYSTITNNVNLLLVNSSTITLNAPYVAYISSINVPGRIATVRDAVGLVSSPGRLIILSTLKDVLFSDGTSSITISQPFGYISLSSRDKNTWDIINTFAFPMPSPVSYVSSIYATDRINANNMLARSYVSTGTLTTDSISSYRIQASTISTANLFSQNLRGVNTIFTSISSQTLSTNSIFANSISTNTTISQNVLVSSLTLSHISSRASLTLSNDGQALLVNGIPTGTFRAISTATTSLNMNNNSISNVLNLSTLNVTASNVLASNLQVNSISSTTIRADTISTILLFANTISTNRIFTDTISTNRIFTDTLFANSISTTNTNTKNINTSTITLFDAFTNTYMNPIYASTGQVYVNNQLNVTPYFTLTQGLINTSYLDNCNNNIQNVNMIGISNATISLASISNIRTDSISVYNSSSITFSNNVNFNDNSISNVNTLNATTITLTPNYILSNSAADIISAAPQAFTNLLFPSVMNSLVSRTTLNENNTIKTTSGQQKIWNIDFSLTGTTFNTNTLVTYFTLSNLTQSVEYSFDTYNSNNYLYIKPTTNNPTDITQSEVLLHLRDTFRGSFDNNDLICLNFYSTDNSGTNRFVNYSIISPWFNPTTYDTLDYTCAAYGDHTWLIGANDGSISYSTDNGVTFDTGTSKLVYTGAIAYGKGLYIATGFSADGYPINVSTDGGINFDDTAVTGRFFDLSGHGIAYGNGVWVAVGMNSSGAGSIIYSTDGYDWSGATGTNFSVGGRDVHFANNIFIAVGDDGAGTNTILRSSDGQVWSTVGGSTFSGTNIGYSVSYGYGRWYAVGDDKIYVSDNNGATWSDSGSSFFTGQKLLSIVVGEGIILGGSFGIGSKLYYTTSNLNSFTEITVSIPKIYGLAYGNKRYMAVGNGDGILLNNAKNILSYTLQPIAVQPP